MPNSMRIVVEPVMDGDELMLEHFRLQLMDSNLEPVEMNEEQRQQAQNLHNPAPLAEGDALRYMMCAKAAEMQMIHDCQEAKRARHLYNKLWSVALSAMLYFPGDTIYKPPSSPLPESLSLLNRWMLSRVSLTVQRVNCGYKKHDFQTANKYCYNLWLHDICRIYLEYLKTVFAEGSSTEKADARQTLYTTLEMGVRLLSLFMPNLSQNLKMRLPKHDSSYTSFSSFGVAHYPNEATRRWRSVELEANVALALKIVRGIRSKRLEHNVIKIQKSNIYIVTELNEVKEAFRELQSLANSELSDDSPPSGCSMVTVSDKVEVHWIMKGNIKPLVQIKKLEKKKEDRIPLPAATGGHSSIIKDK